MKHLEEKKQDYRIAVFCDFDGTITYKDIGDELFRDLGDFEEPNRLLREGTLSIKDYWRVLCKSLKPHVNKDLIRDYALGFEVDPYFGKFCDYCSSLGISVSVVSDGFREYILPVLEKAGQNDLKVYCNYLNGTGKNVLEPVYPGASESCSCLCASCKRNVVIDSVPEDFVTVFIGDGYSDYCAAEHSDIVFAKLQLAAYCNEKRIPHYPYSNFFDVLRIFKKIIAHKDYRFRHQARLLRKKAYEIE